MTTDCPDFQLHYLATNNGRACPVCQPEPLTLAERRQAKRDQDRIARAERKF